MSDVEVLERRLDEHTRQDHENFMAIREALEKVNDKLDIITERTVKLETVHETASKSGAVAGSRWSAIIAVLVTGVFQACNWVSGIQQ